jgi:predicted  nucleic acid-binding Zn-ribbon protein
VPDGVEEQLRLVAEVLQGLAAELRDRDDRRQGEIAVLRQQVRILREQSAYAQRRLERDLTALYEAQLAPQKGINP